MIDVALLLLLTLAPEHMGAPLVTLEGLADPAAVALNERGDVYVIERGADHVRVFNVDGTERARFGSRGSGPGELLEPNGIALGPRGACAVLDGGNARVHVMDARGNVLRTFGGRGPGDAELCEPAGLAWRNGRIYVADTGNARVAVFTEDGSWLGATQHATLRRPRAVDVDAAGAMYVLESGTARVLRFDRDGRFVGSFGTRGPPWMRLVRPNGLSAADGLVHVADTAEGHVQVYDASGKPIYAWGLPARRARDDAGRLHGPHALALSSDGAYAAVCEPWLGRVQLFGLADGELEHEPHAARRGRSDHGGAATSVAAAGPWLATLDPDARVVHVFRSRSGAPEPWARAGGRGAGRERFDEPVGVAIDVERSLLWVADAQRARLCAFDLTRESTAAQLADRLRLAWAVELEALDADPRTPWPRRADALGCAHGELYMLDARSRSVLVLGAELQVVREIMLGARVTAPISLAVSSDGEMLAVGDAHADGVFVFDARGRDAEPLELGAGAWHPTALAYDAQQRLLVVDARTRELSLVAPDGDIVSSWGRFGDGPDAYAAPVGAAHAGADGWYVVDPGNRRSALLSPEGAFRLGF